VAFLHTLTGDQPTFPLLPPSTDATPQPHPFD
jgi:cytochrome c peroxidase